MLIPTANTQLNSIDRSSALVPNLSYQPTSSQIAPPTARSISQINLARFRASNSFSKISGANAAIVVIDTGIDLDDPAFGADLNQDGVADRIVYSYDFSGSNDTDAHNDADPHGSIVSGIAAAVAPGANIIHLKVFPDGTTKPAEPADIEEALKWVADHAAQYNIVSVNMSLASAGNFAQATPFFPYSDEFELLNRKGVAVVTAAGNAFAPGVDFGISGESADPNSISVGAVWDGNYGKQKWQNGLIDYSTGRDRVISFAQRHPKLLDVLAPGSLIADTNQDGTPEVIAGTSFAAPYVSGTVALAQELALQELGRRLTVKELTQLLKTTGAAIYDGDDENDSVTNADSTFQRIDLLGLGGGILTAKTGTLPTAKNDRLLGTSGDNYLSGFGGHDMLSGRAGEDTLVGGTGNDRLIAGQADDLLFGGKGEDRLLGGSGNDWLSGEMGKDYLKGGADADRFFFQSRKTGFDTIADFDASENDAIVVSAKGFGGRLKTGTLSEKQFSLGFNEITRNTRFIYETSTGSLFFDADGIGRQKQVLIAKLSADSDLSSSNISVIA